mmetsp:Transcript_9272/g.19563  ORF Transcript_9272/g.19563 Transcript_9272/m.19563 type:complete len:370 (+) Transcript_9272:146-1255(+)
MIYASIVSRQSFFQSIAVSFVGTSIVPPADVESTSNNESKNSLQLVPNTVENGQNKFHLHSNAINAPQSSLPLENKMELASYLVRKYVDEYLKEDPAMAGSLLRLAFHDAATREERTERNNAGYFTGGPNGSIQYELLWNENRGISRPLEVVQKIQYQVNEDLKNHYKLSLVDCIALAGAQAVQSAGGPVIAIKMGRNDVAKADPKEKRNILQKETSRSLVDTTLPSPGLDSDGLRLYFGALGLSEEEFVSLCGAHDLGRHVTLLNMPKECLKNLTRQCLEEAPVLMPFISENPDQFSNIYFEKLLKWYDREVSIGEVAFIPTDVDLVVDEGLRSFVERFARDEDRFFDKFTDAYVKLVDVGTKSRGKY